MTNIILVLGGARSGKSRYAEKLITAHPSPWIYAATAQLYDDEMRERVAAHREARGPGWECVEEPLAIDRVLDEAGHNPVLVDCLTLWLSNLILGAHDISAATSSLLDALERRRVAGQPVVLVGSEVGLAIVPENALARRFRDEAGILHQKIAAIADKVALVVAGYPIMVKT